ncbi:hypothetical protein V1639_08900 [Pseudarthrobacter sp. J75]|uniref:hypothetical protein n=1 Tax=Pseudarthrobacter sp. J75 TaxID=3116486 RepID=UPI002E813144|nr:hypothetical protein [Pseudarthrobacter sp. J75]MEE2529146.1 hypothetical protein [Pseudarthrobacter sp. J75]
MENKCTVCGKVMTGRADRKFCSAACRQKAYRNREPEPLQQSDAEFLTDIRHALQMMPIAARQRNLSPRALQVVIDDAKELIDTLTEELIEATVKGQEQPIKLPSFKEEIKQIALDAVRQRQEAQ